MLIVHPDQGMHPDQVLHPEQVVNLDVVRDLLPLCAFARPFLGGFLANQSGR